MINILSEIKALAGSYFSEIVQLRRQIHKNPELAFEEYDTANLICDFLRSNNIEFTSGVAKTGVVALIKGKNPGKKTVALRADMDALPIIEKNDVAYKSANEGKMHACGHDVHTSSLLGTAKILQSLKEKFEGTVKFIFQPSEENIREAPKL